MFHSQHPLQKHAYGPICAHTGTVAINKYTITLHVV